MMSALPDLGAYLGRLTESTDPIETPDDLPEFDTLMTLISEERRRLAIRHLAAIDDGTGIDQSDLDELIAMDTYDIDGERVPADKRKSVHVGMYQVHLPQLDDAGIVDYDQRANVVRATETTQFVAWFIEDLRAIVEGSR